MGMFDNLRVKVPLPGEHPFTAETVFQTKCLACEMNNYVIEEDGRLMERMGRYEEVPKAERPYPTVNDIFEFCGSVRFVEEGWREVWPAVTRTVNFYISQGDTWYEWLATYTHGKLEEIIVVYIGDLKTYFAQLPGA